MNWTFNLIFFSRYRRELYGISILSIVIFHYFETLLASGETGVPFYIAKVYIYLLGSIGVDLFLFLSGIGVCNSLQNNPGLKSFYVKRFKRVVLPYILLGLVFWFVKDCVLLKQCNRFLKDYFLLTFWTAGIRTLWYVALIVVLYTIAPILYYLKRIFYTRKNMILLGCIFVLLCLSLLMPEFFRRCEIALLRIPIFILGFIYSERVMQGEKINWNDFRFLFLFIPINIICFLLHSPFRRLADGLFSVLIAIILSQYIHLMSNSKLVNFVSFFGTISYELYLIHVMGRNILNTINFGLESIMVYFLFIAVCIIISIFLHKGFRTN